MHVCRGWDLSRCPWKFAMDLQCQLSEDMIAQVSGGTVACGCGVMVAAMTICMCGGFRLCTADGGWLFLP